jgi:PHD/YefM family antitoxin component YafN of YafNO toxin-antitoxin module
MITTTVTARDILRDYKSVFNDVRNTRRPAIVTAHKEPQVAIVSLDDLEELQRLKNKDSAKNLLDFSERARKLFTDEKLPKDLATNHDNYLWGK